LTYFILGPPQLSTMLSVNEPLDFPYDTHEETLGNSISQTFESLNIQQKKGFFF